MICTEVDGMKRALVKILFPALILVFWMLVCYLICNEREHFDFMLFWILAGFPYGIRKMCVFLVPRNYGITDSIAILAFNGIVGGLIGGFVVLLRMVQILMETIKLVIGCFWTQCPKV